MLPHYSPLKIAETFSILAGLHPGRLALGVGRAPGTDGQTMFALQRDRRQTAPDDFPEQLLELLAYLEAGFPAGHPWARLAALPGGPERPRLQRKSIGPSFARLAGRGRRFIAASVAVDRGTVNLCTSARRWAEAN